LSESTVAATEAHGMSRTHRQTTTAAVGLTGLAMVAFAANSVLCRLALRDSAIDPASFTAVRLLSGALALWVIIGLRGGTRGTAGNWPSAFALFAYAAAFSFAYVTLPAGAGALLLFGAVQATMILAGLRAGERLGLRQSSGLALALGGLLMLLSPGLSAPPLVGSLLMLGAGAAWGIYSLRGRGVPNATAATAGNFRRAAALGLGLGLAMLPWARLDASGFGYAALSGALASGAGYAVWYAALRSLSATTAATVQLSVPVIAALGGILFLGEPITLRLALSSAAILGGIALVAVRRGRTA
jgi:drug/metabolite transporter (DMT)-like permease